MKALTLDGLEIQIGAVTVCRDLNLCLSLGQCWAILGRNGTGKTTLLHTLAGLRAPHSGRISWADTPLTALPRRRIAQHLGLLPQDSHDPFPATVLETALLGRHPHLSPWQWETAHDRQLALQALRQVDLADLATREVDTLSGGERRRLAIATLLTQDPSVMLLDEPTNHLDLQHQHGLTGLLAQLAQQQHKCVIMVLHDLNLAARFADHCLLLFGNGEFEAGSCQEMLTTDRLERLYRQRLRQVSATPPAWLPS